MNTARRLLLLARPYGDVPLTLSGNEITDASRAAGLEGDGLLNDSSFGIWEAATNLCTNGGFETNTTGWTAWGAEASISRVTTQAKFGSASLEVVVTDLGNRGTGVKVSLSATTVYTFSAWVKVPTGATVRLAVYDTPATTQLGGVNVVGNDDWQRASVTFTSDGDGGDHNFYIMTFADYNAVTFYIDGVQIETGFIATPYIETDGATAVRDAAYVRAPSSLLSVTQSWVAFRVRTGWGATEPIAAPRVFSWSTVWDNLINIQRGSDALVQIKNDASGGAASQTASATLVWTAGASSTIVGKWDAAAIYIAANGSAFASAARSEIPDLTAATTFFIGRDAVFSASLYGDVLWFACGTGTLTDADSALLYSWGNADPQWSWFPASAQLTGLWDGRSRTMQIRSGL